MQFVRSIAEVGSLGAGARSLLAGCAGVWSGSSSRRSSNLFPPLGAGDLGALEGLNAPYLFPFRLVRTASERWLGSYGFPPPSGK